MTRELEQSQVVSLRLYRHRLTASSRGRTDSDYLNTLGRLGPMRPPSYEFPGTPVVLFDRHEDATGASQYEVGERIRRERKVFKGRFQGGRVGYVPTSDVPLYLAAYRRERALTEPERAVLDTLAREGPLHKADIAEAGGVKGRELSAALTKLQQSFLVYEEQLATEWDNPWYHLESERGEWVDAAPDPSEARLEVLRRFTWAHVASTPDEVKQWSGFSMKEVREGLDVLTFRDQLTRATVAGWGERFVTPDLEEVPVERSVAVLDPGDPLITAQVRELKRRFQGMPVLKYVLVDGEIAGAAVGRWGIKPFDIDDVVVADSATAPEVREEVIGKLRRHFPLPEQRILAYGGTALDE